MRNVGNSEIRRVLNSGQFTRYFEGTPGHPDAFIVDKNDGLELVGYSEEYIKGDKTIDISITATAAMDGTVAVYLSDDLDQVIAYLVPGDGEHHAEFTNKGKTKYSISLEPTQRE